MRRPFDHGPIRAALLGSGLAMLHYRPQGIPDFEQRLRQIRKARAFAPDSSKMTMRVRYRNSALMHFPRKLRWFAIAAAMMHSLIADAATSDGDASGDVLMVQLSPYSIHFDKGPEHTGRPWLIGVEWQDKSRWLAGFSYFNNSFNQKCEYIYGGYTFSLGETFKNWYIKVTGGLIIGYKEPFEDKLPVNYNGVAPVIIPALGYKYDRFNVQVNFLGANGLMLTFGYDLLR